MNRRGFFGRVAGLLGIPFIPEPSVEHPVHDTGASEITITRFRGKEDALPMDYVNYNITYTLVPDD